MDWKEDSRFLGCTLTGKPVGLRSEQMVKHRDSAPPRPRHYCLR